MVFLEHDDRHNAGRGQELAALLQVDLLEELLVPPEEQGMGVGLVGQEDQAPGFGLDLQLKLFLLDDDLLDFVLGAVEAEQLRVNPDCRQG